MNEQLFYEAINKTSKQLNINPLLLLSGIEGLYTFRDVQLNAINYDFLDSLILTIFALRIGDQFHTLAEQNLLSKNPNVRQNASNELKELTPEQILTSSDPYLQSFARVLNGKSPIRTNHYKALEVAALEIRKAQLIFETESIGLITLRICKDDQANEFGLAEIFK